MTLTFFGILIAIILAVTVSRRFGFRSQKPEHYKAGTPVFDIRQHLKGALLCEGVIYGPFGRVTSRFVAKMQADWSGNVGRMTEEFKYDSGNIQHREWTLSVENDGIIRAVAPDLIGTGQGYQSGSAVCLNYTIELTKDAGGHALNVVDWMYLMENGVIINRSQFRKFGIKVAELVATMRPNVINQIASE